MHSTAPRLIRLRRPAVLAPQPGRFVPSCATIDAVDQAWLHACDANPRLFDGPLWHVAGVSRNGHGGVTLHLIESSYRFHAVRAVGVETGVRPLGVKGIVELGGRVLLGRRSPCVHAEPGRWEFVPGGTLEPGTQPSNAVEKELWEEAALRAARTPVAQALLFDDLAMTWEIIHHIEAATTPAMENAPASWEHDEIVLADIASIGMRELSRSAVQMLPLLAKPTGVESPRCS